MVELPAPADRVELAAVIAPEALALVDLGTLPAVIHPEALALAELHPGVERPRPGRAKSPRVVTLW